MLFGLILAGTGTYYFLDGITACLRARRMRHWPAARGVVSQAAVGERMSTMHDPDSRRLTLYYPDVRYDYVVGDRELRGSRLGAVRVEQSIRAVAERTVARFPVGREVVVYYDPADPRESILERRYASAWAWLGMMASLAAAVGGAWWAIRGFE